MTQTRCKKTDEGDDRTLQGSICCGIWTVKSTVLIDRARCHSFRRVTLYVMFRLFDMLVVDKSLCLSDDGDI